jgi:sialate O-acetylesterase
MMNRLMAELMDGPTARSTARLFVWTGILCSLLALDARDAHAGVRLPAIFSDHMVLQRGIDAPIWGWSDPGEKISVTAGWLPKTRFAEADARGRWELKLPAPGGGGPYTIEIAGSETIVLDDVQFGEVWICSGQSNMEMPVGYTGPGYWGVTDFEKELAAADFPDLRLFTVKRTVALEPRGDCEGEWKRCSPDSARTFSAVGYFFGRALQRELKVPVGLICSAWGGTPAEAWTRRETLAALPGWENALAEVERFRTDPEGIEEEYRLACAAWREACNAADPGLRDGWMAPGFDDAAWKTIILPGPWEGDLDGYDGSVWFRRTVHVPADRVDESFFLDLGPIDDWDIAWVNGRRVGAHTEGNVWQVKRSYPLPLGLLDAGPNEVTLCVIDTGGAGGLYGNAGQVAIRPADGMPGTGLPLAGEWRFRQGAPMKDLPPRPLKKSLNAHSPGALFNGMIAPLVRFPIRGAIWYQGESNRYDPKGYRTLFPAMIGCWRKAWGAGDFPFGFVQIAPFDYGRHGEKPNERTAELREAQLLTLSLPGTGMAVTMDVGNPRDIHPREKRPVGERLALWAEATVYGCRRSAYSGPICRTTTLEGSRVRIGFDHVGSGLMARGGELTHFSIAGADGLFRKANAVIDAETVVVWSDDVAAPVAVRYAWSDAPDPNLFNREGLPASPFHAPLR